MLTIRHKRAIGLLWLMVLGIITLVITPIQAEEIAFTIKQLDINAHIEADGDVAFTDRYLYEIDQFNGATFDIETGPYQLTDHQVSVQTEENGPITPLKEDYTGAPETYRVSQERGITQLKVYYPTTKKRVRFIVQYTIKALVTNYKDTAVLSRIIVPENIADPLDITARIQLPTAVDDPDAFRVWAYGAPHGQVEPRTEDGQSYLQLAIKANPAQSPVEIKMLFPTSMTPNNPNVSDQLVRDHILQEEQARHQAEQQTYRRHQQGIVGVALLGAAVLTGGVWYIWREYRRQWRQANPTPLTLPTTVASPPDALTPAVASAWVNRGQVTVDGFTATLFDLIRRGYATMTINPQSLVTNKKRHQQEQVILTPTDHLLAELTPLELAVYHYIFYQDGPIDLSQLPERIKQDKAFRQRQKQLWNQYRTLTQQQLTESGYIKRSHTGLFIGGWAGLALAIAMLTIGGLVSATWQPFIGGAYWGILAYYGVMLVGYMALVIYFYRHPIRSQDADYQERVWLAYRDWLKQADHQTAELADLPLAEEALVYATAFGVAEPIARAINQSLSLDMLDQSHFPIYLFTHPMAISQAYQQPIQASVAVASPMTYQGTNATGTGGGFSSGTGGGIGAGGGAGGF